LLAVFTQSLRLKSNILRLKRIRLSTRSERKFWRDRFGTSFISQKNVIYKQSQAGDRS
jgi:hypothetical protein